MQCQISFLIPSHVFHSQPTCRWENEIIQKYKNVNKERIRIVDEISESGYMIQSIVLKNILNIKSFCPCGLCQVLNDEQSPSSACLRI